MSFDAGENQKNGINRRKFINTSVAGAALFGGAVAAGTATGEVHSKSQEKQFKLHFAPHPGTFKSAGKDVIDQIKFARDQGVDNWRIDAWERFQGEAGSCSKNSIYVCPREATIGHYETGCKGLMHYYVGLSPLQWFRMRFSNRLRKRPLSSWNETKSPSRTLLIRQTCKQLV